MKIVRTIAESARRRAARRTSGSCRRWARTTRGTCPLRSRARGERQVVASLFVNPAQFGDAADLRALPARRGRDARSPSRQASTSSSRRRAEELYPTGFRDLGRRRAARLRGSRARFRPGHFRGVATICLKLFNIVRPRRAYFGQKDAQQVEVLRRMIRDLNLELELRVLPTVRDADGLALSSRNALLSPRGARSARWHSPARSRRATSQRARELLDRPRRRLRRGRALRPARARRRGPRRLDPPDRQRPPRKETTDEHAACRQAAAPRARRDEATAATRS